MKFVRLCLAAVLGHVMVGIDTGTGLSTCTPVDRPIIERINPGCSEVRTIHEISIIGYFTNYSNSSTGVTTNARCTFLLRGKCAHSPQSEYPNFGNWCDRQARLVGANTLTCQGPGLEQIARNGSPNDQGIPEQLRITVSVYPSDGQQGVACSNEVMGLWTLNNSCPTEDGINGALLEPQDDSDDTNSLPSVIGGLAGAVALVLVVIFCVRRRKRNARRAAGGTQLPKRKDLTIKRNRNPLYRSRSVRLSMGGQNSPPGGQVIHEDVVLRTPKEHGVTVTERRKQSLSRQYTEVTDPTTTLSLPKPMYSTIDYAQNSAGQPQLPLGEYSYVDPVHLHHFAQRHHDFTQKISLRTREALEQFEPALLDETNADNSMVRSRYSRTSVSLRTKEALENFSPAFIDDWDADEVDKTSIVYHLPEKAGSRIGNNAGYEKPASAESIIGDKTGYAQPVSAGSVIVDKTGYAQPVSAGSRIGNNTGYEEPASAESIIGDKTGYAQPVSAGSIIGDKTGYAQPVSAGSIIKDKTGYEQPVSSQVNVNSHDDNYQQPNATDKTVKDYGESRKKATGAGISGFSYAPRDADHARTQNSTSPGVHQGQERRLSMKVKMRRQSSQTLSLKPLRRLSVGAPSKPLRKLSSGSCRESSGSDSSCRDSIL